MDMVYDVVVIGGGAAGLSGAIALARAQRSVLVLDDARPRNAPAGHVHGLLGREGTPPAELLAAGRSELAGYGGHTVAGRAVAAVRDDDGFLVTLADDGTVRARRLLVTTGLVDELPDLPGIAERWGRDVLHCPYCHGWQVRGRRIGVLATGQQAVTQANQWRQWSDQVLLLTNDTVTLDDAAADRLAARQIVVVDGPVAALDVTDDHLTGVRLGSGERVALDALVVAPRLAARSGVLAKLGLQPVDAALDGHVIGERIAADPTGATAVPGVWVAGNVTDLGAQVATAAAAAATAAAAINADLIDEETSAALASYRQARHDLVTQPFWETRYQSRPAIWSGQPNRQLVTEATGLTPGRAMDLGCGEGADAIWLAGRGWQVTAYDIAPTALARGAAAAAAAGALIADRITWTHADLRDHVFTEGGYDLVSAQFVHLPRTDQPHLFTRLAAAVAHGGTLLVVGHHPCDLRVPARRMHFPDLMFTAEDVAAVLDPGVWQVLAADARPRPWTDPDGTEITIHDAVLVARRRG